MKQFTDDFLVDLMVQVYMSGVRMGYEIAAEKLGIKMVLGKDSESLKDCEMSIRQYYKDEMNKYDC